MSLELLRQAFADREHHASPFLVLGDPTPEISVRLAVAAIEHGATMLELGFPYDDPCADGPAIVAADERARAAGVSTDAALEVMRRVRAACPRVPFNLLVYGNLVHARGYSEFCADAAAAGASSVLVPDVPIEEGAPLRSATRAAGIGLVHMVAPLTSAERLAALDRDADGFLYLAAYQGVTGSEADVDAARRELVASTVARVDNPVCLGFGLSKPSHVESAFEAGAKIAVIGSHLARAIESAWSGGGRSADEVERAFLEALDPLLKPRTATPTKTSDSTEGD